MNGTLKFEPDLDFQREAIASATGIFKGQEKLAGNFTVPHGSPAHRFQQQQKQQRDHQDNQKAVALFCEIHGCAVQIGSQRLKAGIHCQKFAQKKYDQNNLMPHKLTFLFTIQVFAKKTKYKPITLLLYHNCWLFAIEMWESCIFAFSQCSQRKPPPAKQAGG